MNINIYRILFFPQAEKSKAELVVSSLCVGEAAIEGRHAVL